MRTRFCCIVLFAATIARAQSLDVTFFVTADTHIRDAATDQIAKNHVKALNTLRGPDGNRLTWPAGAFTKGAIAEPDAVFVAGDLLNGKASTSPNDAELLRSLYIGTPTTKPELKPHAYLALGNHDLPLHSGAFTVNGNGDYQKIRELVLQTSVRNRFSLFESTFGVVPPHYAVTLGGGKLLVVVFSPSLAEPCRKIQSGLTPGLYEPPDSTSCNAVAWLQTTLKNFVAQNGGNKKAPVILIQHYGYDDQGVSGTVDGWRGYWWHPDERARLAESIKDYNVIAMLYGHTHVPYPDKKTKWTQPVFGREVSTKLDVGYNDSRAWADVTGTGKGRAFCRVVKKNGQPIARCTPFNGESFGTDVESGAIDVGDPAGRAWADVNADGKADFCRVVERNAFTGQGKLRCELSTGTAFSGSVESGWLDVGYNAARAWVDVNNDKKADYCRTFGSFYGYIGCALSSGTRFTETPATRAGFGSDEGRTWADTNGDSMLDFCRVFPVLINRGAAVCTLYDSKQDAFGSSEVKGDNLDFGDGFGRTFIDADGDGKADFCRVTDYETTWNSLGAMRCTLSNGSAFSGDKVTHFEKYFGGATARGIDIGYQSGRAWAKFGAWTEPAYCRIVDNDSGSNGRVACSGFNTVTISSRRMDPGFPGGRTWADVNGDGLADYCRVMDSDSATGSVGCALAATAVTQAPIDAFSVASGLCTGDAGGNKGGFSVVHVTDKTLEVLEVAKSELPACGDATYDGSVTIAADKLTKKVIATQ